MDLSIKKLEVEAKPYKLLTYSNVSMFLDCPMKWYFRNVVKIIPIERQKNLTIGSIYHDAIDTYFKTAKRPIDSEAMAFVLQQITKQCAENKSYLESNEDIILQGMVQGFIHRAAQSPYKITETETMFDIKYDDVFHRCGKIDAFLKNDAKQKFLGEWKSASALDTYVKAIQTSNQANNYFWAFEEKEFTGVIFRIAKKSQLRLKKAETVEQFRSRIFDDYMNRPGENFHDEVVYLDEQKLSRWKHEVGQIAEMLKLFLRENCWYRNTGSCWNYNNLCPYHKVCECTSDKTRNEIMGVHYQHCEPGEELFAKKD